MNEIECINWTKLMKISEGKWMHKWTNEWMNERMDGWIGGWVDGIGQQYRQKDTA